MIWFQSRFFKKFDQNRDFRKFGPKSRCFEWNRSFSKSMPTIEIFANFRKFCLKSLFFENFDQTPENSKVWHQLRLFANLTKIAIFQKKIWPKYGFFENFEIFGKFPFNQDFSKFWSKSRLSGIWTKIEMFRIKSRFFEDFDQIWNFSSILTKIDFSKFFPKRFSILRQKLWRKSGFFSIEIFDQNRDKMSKLGIFRKFCPQSILSKIWPKLR